MLYQARQMRHKVYSASVRGGEWAAMEVGAERLRPLSRDVSWQQGGRPRQASLRVARRRSSDEDVVRRPASNRNGYPLAFRPRPDPGQSVGGGSVSVKGRHRGVRSETPARVCGTGLCHRSVRRVRPGACSQPWSRPRGQAGQPAISQQVSSEEDAPSKTSQMRFLKLC